MSSIKLQTKIQRTPRVMQLEGIFDLQAESISRTEIINNIPDLNARPWNVGLIVGPSGAGKTTIAKHLFKKELTNAEQIAWSPTNAVVDDFPQDLSIRTITELLSSVGFSSPPSWLRPFGNLSNGEQFRVNMARILADNQDVAVVDEVTSVIDRTVAQIGSAAIAKTVRARKQKFVAVSCHYDIEEWLQPDWIYQPHIGEFQWRSLQQRPPINIEIIWAKYEAWHAFSKHHYLSGNLHRGAQVYVGLVADQPAVLTAILPFPHAVIKNGRRISRTVVLPDYQGVGIGNKFVDQICSGLRAQGLQIFTTTSHPARVRALNKSPNWQLTRNGRVPKIGKTSSMSINNSTSRSRITTSFKYAGAPNPTIAEMLCPKPRK